jgi:hypothetical protein
MYRADRNLYTDGSKTRLVEENDPDARFLLCAKGQSIPDQLAQRFGLLHRNDGHSAEAKAITPSDDQRIQNKAVTPASAGMRTKGRRKE